MLGSLLQSLDETYERMLCKIDHSLIEDARRILTLLCFAIRPLKVQESIDGIAVENNGSTGLNRRRRLQDADDIREICLGFVDIGLSDSHSNETYYGGDLTPTVRIAHFSVQEYIESERIRHQKAAIFSLNSATAHADIAQICLVYLLELGLSSSDLDQSLVEAFPLAQFAAMYWCHHYRMVGDLHPGIDSLIVKLFQNQHSFVTWVKLHDMDMSWKIDIDFSRSVSTIASPVYYASLLGLDQTLFDLNDIGKAERVNMDFDAQDGYYDNALQAASSGGHNKVVQMLLEKGADVNAQGGHYSNALYAASSGGHNKVVQMLLEKGADVNAQGGHYSNALYAASLEGHNQVVMMLLEKGADVNAQGGYYGNALQAASSGGHEKVVMMLLEKGADVNAQDGYYDNALYAASSLVSR